MHHNIDYFRLIEQTTDKRFAIIEDGVVTKLEDDSIIPIEHVAYQKARADGIYVLSMANCGDAACDIGAPKDKCVKSGIYSPKKCAVWFLHDLSSYSINLNVVLNILDIAEDKYRYLGRN